MLKGFITNLGKYNEGELVGKWISFPIDEDELEDVLECVSLEDAIEYFENENFTYYRDMTLLDVAYDVIDSCYKLDDFAIRYFDFEAFARDLSYDGYSECANGVLYLY